MMNNIRVSISPIIFLVPFLLPAAVLAAPPALTYLYPAGAQRGTTVETTVFGTFERWPVQVWTDQAGVTVQPDKQRGKLQITVAADVPPGICWLRLHDPQGASSLRPFLIGTLPEVMEREPNNDPASPQVLSSSMVTVNGRLEKAGDVDVFALELQQGQTLVAALTANEILKSPLDGVLQILSDKGFVLAQNDDTQGMDPRIIFTAPKSGRYQVRTFAFPATPNSGISFAGGANFIYRLTLTTGGFADHAWPLAVPRSTPGEVDVMGWNIPPAARRLPVLVPPHSETGLVFHPLLANPVPVRLEPHPTMLEKEPNTRQQPQSLEAPVTVTGKIARPGEVDVYEFRVKQGQPLRAVIESRTLDFPLDPVLRLTDGKGKLISQAQAKKLGTDPELPIPALPLKAIKKFVDATAGTDPKLRLEIHDLHDRGGSRFLYRLRLQPVQPDFALKIAGDRFALAPGKTLEIPVTIDRQNGFKEELEIAAADLPPGVSAEPVRAAAAGKSATVRLKAEKDAVSGVFHILGRVQGQPEKLHTALAPVAEMGISTPHCWLTVGPAATAPPDTPKKK